jgi:pyruvate dehydrogenase E2 component (dihydrolipoamide acetyltransferase)
MAKEVIMPKVDMDQETGTVAVDVESPGNGFLEGISVGPGDVVPIGTVIAYLLAEGEDLPQGQKPASKPDQKTPTGEETPNRQSATPLAKNMAAAHDLDLNTIIPSGKGFKITKADVEAKLLGESIEKTDGKIYASPAARRAARESHVDLAALQGSGPKGRIQTNDVIAFIEQRDRSKLPVETHADEAEVIQLIGMRRTIAERMTANYQNIPHINFTARVIMNEFAAARNKLNELAKRSDEEKISATAMLVKLVASTLARHPFLNSSLRNDEILLHRDINIGVAVALENGLIVPVVKNADKKGFGEIAAEVNDLSTRARAGKLINAEVKGGTFTISNLGPFGIEQFDAIINAPEAAILAVGATQLEAIPDVDGIIRSYDVMRMTLSVDHRIVDGAVAARFMADLKTILEAPILMAY